MGCGGGEFVRMSKAAYKEYKERLKATSIFKTNESANQALLGVINVYIPKALDGIKTLTKNTDETISRITQVLDELKSLNSRSLYSNKGHDIFVDLVYLLGTYHIEHYNLFKRHKNQLH